LRIVAKTLAKTKDYEKVKSNAIFN